MYFVFMYENKMKSVETILRRGWRGGRRGWRVN
jgi:hypothetical protein